MHAKWQTNQNEQGNNILYPKVVVKATLQR